MGNQDYGAQLDKVAELLALRAQRKLGKKASLRVVGLGNLHREVPSAPPRSTIDPVTRDAHLKRIRWIARTYRLNWLVDQHVFGLPGAECLEDADLLELHREMEQGAECCREGVPLEDVGLIRAHKL